jgi:hypothetical protein
MQWDYDSQFLPEDCHTVKGFEAILELVTDFTLWESPIPGKLAPQPNVEGYILGMGMLLRDMKHVQFTEELGEETPVYIGDSAMQWGKCQDLLNTCKVLTAALDEEQEEEVVVVNAREKKAEANKYLLLISPVFFC